MFQGDMQGTEVFFRKRHLSPGYGTRLPMSIARSQPPASCKVRIVQSEATSTK